MFTYVPKMFVHPLYVTISISRLVQDWWYFLYFCFLISSPTTLQIENTQNSLNMQSPISSLESTASIPPCELNYLIQRIHISHSQKISFPKLNWLQITSNAIEQNKKKWLSYKCQHVHIHSKIVCSSFTQNDSNFRISIGQWNLLLISLLVI